MKNKVFATALLSIALAGQAHAGQELNLLMPESYCSLGRVTSSDIALRDALSQTVPQLHDSVYYAHFFKCSELQSLHTAEVTRIGFNGRLTINRKPADPRFNGAVADLLAEFAASMGEMANTLPSKMVDAGEYTFGTAGGEIVSKPSTHVINSRLGYLKGTIPATSGPNPAPVTNYIFMVSVQDRVLVLLLLRQEGQDDVSLQTALDILRLNDRFIKAGEARLNQ